MFNNSDFLATLARHKAGVMQTNKANKEAVFTVLAEAEIDSLVIKFDGEGDSGQIEDIVAFKGQDVCALPSMKVVTLHCSYGHEKVQSREEPLNEAIETICYGYLEEAHGGWENNEGAFGEFRLDVAKRHVELNFNARFANTAFFSYEF